MGQPQAQSVLLCAHSPFWTLAPGGSPRAENTPVASGRRTDLWPSEEKLQAAQARASDARDAPGNQGCSHRRLTGTGPLWTAQHGLYRTGESDCPSWNSRAGSSTWATAQQSPHLLAHLEWWRVYYHFVRPHASLRVKLVQPRDEVASWWRNATGSVPQRWHQAEPLDDGRRAKCSHTPCQRFPLERQGSQRWVQCHITGRWVKVLAEILGWSLAPGREGLSGLPHHEKPARSGSVRGWTNYPPYSRGAPKALQMSVMHVCVFSFIIKISTFYILDK